MSDWIVTSIGRSIEILDNSENHDVSRDLRRIASLVDLRQLKLFRWPLLEEISDSLDEAEDLDLILAAMCDLRDVLGVSNVSLHILNTDIMFGYSPFVVTTWPQVWIKRYLAEGYAEIDPVLAAARDGDDDFFYWCSLVVSPISEWFMADAQSQGIGQTGFTCTVTTSNNARIALNLSTTLDAQTFRKRLDPLIDDCILIAENLAECFVEIASSQSARPPERLRRILHALSRGETLAEATQQIDPNILEAYMAEICDFYQARTLSQAVMLCARLGHLDGLSLSSRDIVTSNLSVSIA